MHAQPLQSEPATPAQLRQLADAACLYAVLDACDAPAVPAKAKELGDQRAASLYRGGAEEAYWGVAPYLVCADGAVLDWIAATLGKEPWGVFIVAAADLESLRKHFRRFLVVQDEHGKPWYFRYYDPRILKTFLRAATSDELSRFFGPVGSYGTSDCAAGATTFWNLRRARPTASGGEPPIDGPLLRIRPELWTAFQAQAESAFADRLIRYLRQKLPARTAHLSEEELRRRVARGIAQARLHGLSWESSLTTFVALMFEIAPNFDEQPAIQRVLREESLAPNLRLRLLPERTTDRDWEEARQFSKPWNWNGNGQEGTL